ncbi:MAG TPA: cyclic beta 1-2 glucan synthetase, partial [Casimicrobiaceae bacterium]
CIALAARCRATGYAERLLAAPPSTPAGATADDATAARYLRLAASVMYANASLRADPRIIARNTRGQSGLWGYRISGDLPIVLLQIGEAGADAIALVHDLVMAQAWWRAHGLVADLAIVGAGNDALRAKILEAVGAAGAATRIDQRGGVFVLDDAKLDDDGRTLLASVARVVIRGEDGSLAQQLDARVAPPIARTAEAPQGAVHTPPSPPSRSEGEAVAQWRAEPARTRASDDLSFFNGIGGFAPDGREYVIRTSHACPAPQPWVNVIANPLFGTLVSEAGSSNTWSENAQTFRLTPWSNDAVSDPNAEALYIRDEASGEFWSPTLLPCGGDGEHVVRHGFGYSIFAHSHAGIDAELRVFVAMDAPLKYAVLTLANRSGRARTLSVTGYVEWVLGDTAANTRMQVVTERDAASGALFARNRYNSDFASRVALFSAPEAAGATHCCDRAAFLGRNGTLRNPAAMSQPALAPHTGAALDPCAAIRIPLLLADGESREMVFLLGAAQTPEDARVLALRGAGDGAWRAALAVVDAHWRDALGAVQVATPDRSLDVLANGWLLYQVLACRMWARNAFYQSSGAYGFRDQLQDSMALVHARPDLVREHLMRCAARQFAEGDVQHWWHPPSGRGIRTHCSDDYLWLPFAACRYVDATGDSGVLDARAPFLEGSLPGPGTASVYELPREAASDGSLYEHCVRAIERGLATGAHGLPLMGTGDWNDGMNLVGAGGKGESVWLAFFLCAVLAQFGALAQRRGDAAFAQRCADALA